MNFDDRLKYVIFERFLRQLPSGASYIAARTLAPLLIKQEPLFIDQLQRFYLSKKSAFDCAAEHRCLVAEDILDTYHLAYNPRKLRVELKNFHVVKQGRLKQQPIILTTAHYGRYWPVGLGLRTQGFTSKAIVRDRQDINVWNVPHVEFEFRRWKLSVMEQVFGSAFHVAGQSARKLKESLKHSFVISLFDVPVDTPNVSTSHRFLEYSISMNLHPAKLAKITGALLVPFFNTVIDGNHLVYEFFEPIDPETLDIDQINEYLVRLLEIHVCLSPERWWLWPAMPLFTGTKVC